MTSSSKFIGNRVCAEQPIFIGHGVRIYGATHLGSYTFIDNNVVIGYPVKAKILKVIEEKLGIDKIDDLFDILSNGSVVGFKVIIRGSTTIYEDVAIGDEVEIGHNVVIREKSEIKSGCRIGTGTIIDGNVVIGENTIIQSNVYIPPGVRIGNRVFIAPRAVFTNDRYPPSRKLAETVIEDEVVIGANSVITPGVVIGRGAVVAAGSIVTKSVKPYVVVAGTPARTVMTRDEYEDKKKRYEEGYVFPYR